MKHYLLVISILLFTVNAYSQDKIDFDELLNKTVRKYENISDYTCTFHKKELIRGRLIEERNIFLKFKKPPHFYMKWLDGKNKGIEAIYVDGKYNNKLVVHLGGMLSFIKISIDPEGKLAMRNNRHPIMEAGIGQIISIIEKNYRMSKNDTNVFITYEGEHVLSGNKSMLIKAVFPERKEYYGHIIYLYFEKESYLPIKITVYDWENQLIEDYYFEDIKLNVGLTEKDFDTDNPDYDF